jgi:nickel-dependent lactate racemase
LVKALHPIDEIAARISRADGEGVRLTRKGGGSSNGESRPAAANGEGLCVDAAAAAIVRALASPIDFPPLAAGIVPGDKVAIVVDSAVPCLTSIVRGSVEALQFAGVEPEDISIVTSDAQTSQLCRDELPGDAHGPQFVVHDPDDENNVCLVGTTKRGMPLLVNRTIFDADVVLPIGCARLNSCSAYETLFPRFSNAEALDWYRTPAHHGASRGRNGKMSEADEAGWLIGVPLVVQVVPGPGETVAHVLAGEPQAVANRGKELCRELWSLQSPQRVSLMIATVTGGPAGQTWGNVGRALALSETLVAEEGAVAICCNLDEPPGESLGRLIGSDDLEVTARKISHDHGDDSWPAWHLARALQRGPVYFLSQLDAETVEDLGLAPVESVDELVRLAGRHESFAVVEDSQNAVVTVAAEADER